MNAILTEEFDRTIVTDHLQEGVHQQIVSCVNETIDRGITRIKRNALVDALVKTLLGYASINSTALPAGKEVVFDTVACRFTILFNGPHKSIITVEGNDELSAKLLINMNGNELTVNGNNLEYQSLLVMLTSLLLKNSQDGNAQCVEVFTKS